MTCHDYYSVYYNSSLMQYVNDTIQIFPIESLGRSRALLSRTSEGSLIYDIAKKMHWHISRLLGNPAELFDMYLCPSPFMQTALIHAGMSNAVVLKNPAVWDRSAIRPEPVKREKISLAYVGRIVAEKGLPQFLTLAQSTSSSISTAF